MSHLIPGNQKHLSLKDRLTIKSQVKDPNKASTDVLDKRGS